MKSIPVCPCKDCTERSSICHSVCSDYKQWDILNKAENSRIFKQKQLNMPYEDYSIKKTIKGKLKKEGIR